MKYKWLSFSTLSLLAALAFGSFDAFGQAPSFITNGLVAYYPADGDVQDASGFGHHGINSGVAYVVDRFGRQGRAWGFLTRDPIRSVRINDVLIKQGQDKFTTTVWFQLSTNTVFTFASTILNTSPHPAFFLGFDWANSPMPIYDIGTGVSWEKLFQGGPTVSWDHAAWHHLSFVRDGDNCRLFFDSVLVQQTTALTRFVTDTSMVIGNVSFADTRYGFTGALDDIRIYDRALSDSEIKALYEYESGPSVSLIKAVKPAFSNLTVGNNYQLQLSSETTTWTNQGAPFTATSSTMVYPQYWDVNNWADLFFRIATVP
jgi:Concanavalin A-like lectin/glucanases superfamily